MYSILEYRFWTKEIKVLFYSDDSILSNNTKKKKKTNQKSSEKAVFSLML